MITYALRLLLNCLLFSLFIFINQPTKAQSPKYMYLIKLNGTKAELRQTNGNMIRQLGNNDVIFADLNSAQDHVLLTTQSGKVELRSLNNNLIRYMGNGDAIDARWNGNDMLIRTKSGKLELRSLNNNLLRYL